MTFNEYQVEAMKNKVYGYGDKVTYPALGLGNEAGEVLGKIKKVLRDNGGVYDQKAIDAIKSESGDVLWYLAALADDLGITLEEVAQDNMTKLLGRRERGTIKGSGDVR